MPCSQLRDHSTKDHLLLLEHDHVVTLSRRTPRDHLLVDVEALGAAVVDTDRGGDITYHGPGQLVGYPILTVPGKRGGGMADTAAYVDGIEQVLIEVLADLGVEAGRLPRCTGVWVDCDSLRPRKIAAIGVRITKGRSMHGFALNVDPDLAWFDRIVPCGITDKGVTSLAAEGVEVSMRDVVDLVATAAAQHWGGGRSVDRAEVAWRVPRPISLPSPVARARVRRSGDRAWDTARRIRRSRSPNNPTARRSGCSVDLRKPACRPIPCG